MCDNPQSKSEFHSQSYGGENSQLHNKSQQDSHSLQVKRGLRPLIGIRQYTNHLSPKSANPGFIKRSRLIYDKLCPELSRDYLGWYIAVEPDSGEVFLNANKALAQQQARQKHPERLICTFKVTAAGA